MQIGLGLNTRNTWVLQFLLKRCENPPSGFYSLYPEQPSERSDVFSGCFHAPAGCTVIVDQPASNLGPDSPEGQNQPIPLAMAVSSPAGAEEHSGDTLPESK